MGRIFEKRKDRMFARWAKNAKAFTKMGKEIAIAVKLGGSEPSSNPRLRMAIETARGLNMPKDRIEAAIKRASGKEQAELIEISYPGYGPHGVALYVDAATDNTTRTAANVRGIFTRFGGSLATPGALDFLFQRKGIFRIPAKGIVQDDLELDLIDYGLEELTSQEGDDGESLLIITVDFASFGNMQKHLEEKKISLLSAGAPRIPLTTVELSDQQYEEVQKLIEKLEEDDDVQHVFDNIA